jgi:ATP-dependent Clp protease protease subunit
MDNKMMDPLWMMKRHLLMDDIDDTSVIPAMRFLFHFENAPKEEEDHLTLIVNSHGGAVHSALALIHLMETHKFPIATFATGMAASCGLLISMAGTKGLRKVHKNCSVLSHEFSTGMFGNYSDLEADTVHLEHLDNVIVDHYRKHTGKSRSYIKKHLLRPTNVWLTAEEAVRHGLYDEVVG